MDKELIIWVRELVTGLDKISQMLHPDGDGVTLLSKVRIKFRSRQRVDKKAYR